VHNINDGLSSTAQGRCHLDALKFNKKPAHLCAVLAKVAQGFVRGRDLQEETWKLQRGERENQCTRWFATKQDLPREVQ
jgi:hypothetical protein